MTGMNEQRGSRKSHQGEHTMTTNKATNPGRVGRDFYRTTARVVGVVYLAGFVVGIGGDLLIRPILDAPDRLAAVAASSMTLAIGAILWLMAVLGDAAHGVLMYPVLKPHHQRIAVGYLAARIMDAVFIAVMVLLILFQIPLANEYVNAAASDSLALASPEQRVGPREAVCLSDRHEHAGREWPAAVLYAVPGTVNSTGAGHLGSGWLRGHFRRDARGNRGAGPGPGAGFGASRRPVGSVHRGVAARQGLQFIARSPVADHLIDDTRADVTRRGQRDDLIPDVAESRSMHSSQHQRRLEQPRPTMHLDRDRRSVAWRLLTDG